MLTTDAPAAARRIASGDGEVQRGCGVEVPMSLADAPGGHIGLGLEGTWMLGVAYFWGTGMTSRRLSISACTDTEMVLGSPITQPWL